MNLYTLQFEEESEMNELDSIKNLESEFNNTKKIVIMVYGFSNSIEEVIKYSLKLILTKYKKEKLINTVYNIIFESILNGVKANAKKLFFIEHSLNILDSTQYQKGVAEFKKFINKSNLRSYGLKNKEKGVYVKVQFNFDENGLEIEILNNTLLLPSEELRIREKLALGEKYDNLMSYYMENADNTEGEGLGLVLSLILLKAEQLDPSLYRIGTKEGNTFARIEIPFNSNFISKRHLAI